MIAPLHNAAQAESATPQAQPLGPEGGDEDKGQQARAGGEESDGWSRRVAADELAVAARGDESGDGVGGGDLERGGAVVELVVQDLGVRAGDLEVAQGVGVQAVYAGWAGCCLACRSGARLAGLHLRRREWEKTRRPTIIDLADFDNLDRAAGGPPLSGPGVEQVVVQVGGGLDVLPAGHGETVGDVCDEDLYVRPGEPGVEDKALDAEDQICRVVAPPADVVEAQVQDEDIRAVGCDLGVQGVDVLPGRAAVDGEVGAASAGGEERRHGWVIRSPGLGIGRVDVDGVYRGREGAVEGAHVLDGRVGFLVIAVGV